MADPNTPDWKPVTLSKRKAPKHIPQQNKIVIIDEIEPTKIQTISLTLRQQIQQERQKKGMSRKDLAQKINVKESLIAEYENGSAVPNNRIIHKIQNILGCKFEKYK